MKNLNSLYGLRSSWCCPRHRRICANQGVKKVYKNGRGWNLQMSKWGYPIDDSDEMDDSAACRVLVALYGQTWFQGFKTSDSASLASPVSLDSAL